MSEAGVIRVTHEGTTLTFAPGERVSIGRHPESEIAILHSRVSRHHAEVAYDGGLWTLRDLGSTNGTFVRGELVSELTLTGPVKVNLGDIDGPGITLVPEALDGGAVGVDGATVAVGGADPVRSETVSIVAGEADLYGRGAKVVRIGRAPENDVIVADDSASWFHAELRSTDDGHEIVDLNSHNGTFVNGKRVSRSEVRELDLIGIGSAVFRFKGDRLSMM